ncbi:uncharacterized protein MYCFIDRAFT_84074 [Pseudocercospora fijiensis CIRAD86]|uniref:Uncharacterized protein n=1 Tax=Pseudocercospora fijiensis (strain CIRAD86) TaxID=383855 RepID=M3B323_PSEFD|nr:uncharacterized protein MYCFIDRAFT_84074 [Pseudocercospora fijiensis CIRAD86]EME83762.1 hypothetical protein MYCFIDRAFT_84074 [Pseudocercospora fijiensis CIRAD86]
MNMVWGIQTSAVVSMLITACRICLAPAVAEGIGQLKWVYFEQRPQCLLDSEIFDETGRALWGASVTATGALLAILSLTIGPFAQQVLHTDVLQTDMLRVTARAGAAHTFNSGSQKAYVFWSDDNKIGTACADTLIARAAYSDLFASDTETNFLMCFWPLYMACVYKSWGF